MIKVVCIGKLDALENEKITYYQKQLRDVKLTIQELAHGSLAQESKAMLKHVNQQDFNIILDSHGEQLSSHAFSKILFAAPGNITFFIGGADGLSDDIKQLANQSISFGKMTWPHALARVMLVEQIYRGEKIKHNHPYHK